jgi:hypothetical protein
MSMNGINGYGQGTDCAENKPQSATFGQTIRKSGFREIRGLTPAALVINIRPVLTRQAIPP